MIGETTYNKYKRQNMEMESILSIDVKNFILDAKDWQERARYLKVCIDTYGHNKLNDALEQETEVKE